MRAPHTLEGVIKHHLYREMHGRSSIRMMVEHHDMVQTLRRCVEIPEYVVGPFNREWAFEALSEVLREAADREYISASEATDEQEREAHDATHTLLLCMASEFVKAATR